MKILIVAMGIAPESGGPTRSCKGLCRALAQAGVEVTLYVLHGRHPFENPGGVRVVYAEDAPLGAFISSIRQYDLVHLQGLWDPGLHRVASACRRIDVPYLISPRGMLDPWALSVKKWKKRLALFLYQRRDLKGAVAFHVTAEMEKEHVRSCGFVQPSFVAPNGVEVPPSAVGGCIAPRGIAEPAEQTAIFLSRLHPGKGLLTLADAWARVKPSGWRMLIVGPDSYGHKAEVVARLGALGISDQWQFLDEVDDVRKWSLYRSADLLVHPSVSENFGITIAEGLYAGLPVIATRGTPWADLERHRCGWWIEQGVDALAEALRAATALGRAGRSGMGARGRRLIEEKYLWPAIGREMANAYRQILQGKAGS